MTGSFLIERVKYGANKQKLFQKGQAGTIQKSILHITDQAQGQNHEITAKGKNG